MSFKCGLIMSRKRSWARSTHSSTAKETQIRWGSSSKKVIIISLLRLICNFCFTLCVLKQIQGNVAQAQHSISRTKKLEDVSGHVHNTKQKVRMGHAGNAKQKEEATVRGSRGRRQQWKEGGPDLSHYLTMDYSNVRRRRPIHNKSFPAAPWNLVCWSPPTVYIR